MDCPLPQINSAACHPRGGEGMAATKLESEIALSVFRVRRVINQGGNWRSLGVYCVS